PESGRRARPPTAPPPLPPRPHRVTGSVRPLGAPLSAPALAPIPAPLPLPPIEDAADDLPLVDLTTRPSAGRRWWPIAIAAAAVAAVIVIVATRGGTRQAAAPAPAPVVTSLAEDAGIDAPPPIDAAAVVEVPVDAGPRQTEDRVRPGGTTHHPIDAGSEGPSAPEAGELRAKFSAATREYKAYKERMGDRLEAEWTDLATRAGYLSTPEKRAAFDKAIDHFRALMRQ
ncbi:MAG TPA: hypothetical protein VHE35_21910, partial [Kofleriaceae bacterium]|nr:hypothetical protein [Kofleriaceae bacterium]